MSWVLGEDGRLHRAEVTREFSGDVMEMVCDAVPLRPLTDYEARLLRCDEWRGCEDCNKEEAHD